jgi:hypothetical protein
LKVYLKIVDTSKANCTGQSSSSASFRMPQKLTESEQNAWFHTEHAS